MPIARRFFVAPVTPVSRAAFAALALAVFCGLAAGARAEAPSVYMQRVAKELVTAARSGSAAAFAATLRSHADIPTIGLYSLGAYARTLPQAERPTYYSGMINWIARYVASESPKYPVVSAVVLGQTEETKKGAYVDSRVTLKDGSAYDVRWWLVRRGQTFKVADAQVLGFWARESLKDLFEKYIAENGGNPRALIIALNR